MSTQEELVQTPEGGALQTAKDLFAGAVGGVAQVLVGKHHPRSSPSSSSR
jgi:solute carrier family 25 (mitochondrial carnitine/acylcarnitine transporter), member 20/29